MPIGVSSLLTVDDLQSLDLKEEKVLEDVRGYLYHMVMNDTWRKCYAKLHIQHGKLVILDSTVVSDQLFEFNLNDVKIISTGHYKEHGFIIKANLSGQLKVELFAALNSDQESEWIESFRSVEGLQLSVEFTGEKNRLYCHAQKNRHYCGLTVGQTGYHNACGGCDGM
jgi:hypothetical protein